MTSWRLRIRPRSQWATPFRADSLFGAICWRWSELFPETFPDMLASFHDGNPSFILSDGFPGDLLPLPLHAATPARERKPKLVCNAEKLIHFTAVKMSHRELVVSALSSEIEIV